jgi:hypothetical protein
MGRTNRTGSRKRAGGAQKKAKPKSQRQKPAAVSSARIRPKETQPVNRDETKRRIAREGMAAAGDLKPRRGKRGGTAKRR